MSRRVRIRPCRVRKEVWLEPAGLESPKGARIREEEKRKHPPLILKKKIKNKREKRVICAPSPKHGIILMLLALTSLPLNTIVLLKGGYKRNGFGKVKPLKIKKIY